MTSSSDARAGVAVIGMAGRFPGARNVREFWRNLQAGVESITFFAAQPRGDTGGPAGDPGRDGWLVGARGVLEEAELFDAGFFGIAPSEAEVMDPQHRVFLETAWEALEDAGCDPGAYPGLIGLFAGMSPSTYFQAQVAPHRALVERLSNVQAVISREPDFLTTRVAYKLNLRGPCMTVQTGCSTSLVAVGLAWQSLMTHQCDIALAGGVSITFPQHEGYRYQEGGIGSRDGHCRAFDAAATGTVFGHGAGIVVLKRVEAALADGDHIYAVIRSVAINNDGAAKVSYAAPGVDGQAQVIAAAHALAGINPRTVSYVEAHGTGTPLGDPIEVAALTQAFRTGTLDTSFCAIGSVKTNIGHLDAAAGVAGLMKTALALEHRLLPPSLHFIMPNPRIDFATSPFYVNASLRPWPATDSPRRAGVSSFGIGGTNAHVMLEEAPSVRSTPPVCAEQLVVVSARTRDALDTTAAALARHLREQPESSLADVAFTLQTGRRRLEHRCAVVARDGAELAGSLEGQDPRRVLRGEHQGHEARVAFLFPGQGVQHVGMGAQLYRVAPAFREEVDACAEWLAAPLGLDLRRILYPEAAEQPAAAGRLDETRLTQPALFVTEYALARLWIRWGIQPSAMIGHSLGEYVAACLAGTLSREDALALVVARAALMQTVPPGAMLAVRLPAKPVESLLGPDLSVAALNAPSVTVVSGPVASIEALERQLAAERVACSRLASSHAFHSGSMDAIIQRFRERVRLVTFRPPQIPWVSSLTGDWISAAQAGDPEYWVQQLRQPVRFSEGIGRLFEDPRVVLLEVGPGETLRTMVTRHPDRPRAQLVLASLARSPALATEAGSVLEALGRLWIGGVEVDWASVHGGSRRQPVSLPTYPFQRKRYWIQPPTEETGRSPVADEPAAQRGPERPPGSNGHREPAARPVPTGSSRHAELTTRLQALFTDLAGLARESIDVGATFAELGLDSLFLTQASTAIQKSFGVAVSFRQLMEELSTVDTLAAYLDARLPIERSEPSRPGARVPATPPGGISDRTAVREAVSAGSMEGEREAACSGLARLLPRAAPAVAGVERPATEGGDEILTAPLTDAQRELWMAAKMGADASRSFVGSVMLELRGPLRVLTLKGAIEALVARHDALRLTFGRDGEEQRVVPATTFEVPLRDLSGLDGAACSTRLTELIDAALQEPFDLSRGPMLRVQILRLAVDRHLLELTWHHLAVDGWSLGVLLSELARLYADGCAGRLPVLPPAPRFVDYARWQSRWRDSEARKAAEAYWVEQFAGHVPVLELPTDRPRPSSRTYTGARERKTLPASLCEGLRDLAARQNSTLFATLLTGFTLLLHRLTGQEDVVVGIPVAGQVAVALPGLVGHCVNFLPLRSRIDPGAPLSHHLTDVKRRLLDGHEHQHYSYGSLVQRLTLPRDPSRAPLVTASFNLNAGSESLEFDEVVVEGVTFQPRTAVNFDIVVNVVERDGQLTVEWEYNTDLLEAETVRRWIGHFRTLLEGMVRDPQCPVGALEILTPSERGQLVEAWNDTRLELPTMASVVEAITLQVERTPERLAVESGGKTLTYRELGRRADQLARHLRELGVGPDVVVGLCVERSVDLVVGLLGVLQAGGAYLPLDPTHPSERLAFMLAEAAPPVLVTQTPLLDRLPVHGAKVVCLDGPRDELAPPIPGVERNGGVTPDTLAYLIYTSGSTGRPKGVEIPHRAVINLLHAMQRQLHLTEQDAWLSVTTLSFDIAVLELLLPLMVGARVVVMEPDGVADPSQLSERLTEAGITIMQATPTTWRQLLEYGWKGHPGLTILCGGEALPRELAATLLDRATRVWNVYGPTETTVWSTAFQVTAGEGAVLIGRPIANTQVYVLDAQGHPVPIGVPGELYIGGLGVARGYLKRPELTRERFVSHPAGGGPGARVYRTGDRVRFRSDGNLEFLGRLDDQVKVRGHRIEPGEIETALRQHPAVRTAAVVACETAPAERHLVGYLVTGNGPAPSPAALQQFLRSKLPPYMVPSAFVYLDMLPRTPSGKVDRRALPSLHHARAEGDDGYVPPRTPIEETIARIWADVLSVDRIGINDNFFDLGGHSLRATQVISRVRRALELEIPLRRVFETPTVAGLAEYVELGRWAARGGSGETTVGAGDPASDREEFDL